MNSTMVPAEKRAPRSSGFPMLMIVLVGLISSVSCFVFGCIRLDNASYLYGGILLALMSGGHSPELALVTTAVSLAVKGALALYACFGLKLRLRFGRPEPGMLGELFRFSFFIFVNRIICTVFHSFFW